MQITIPPRGVLWFCYFAPGALRKNSQLCEQTHGAHQVTLDLTHYKTILTRALLTRALGINEDVEVDAVTISVQASDMLVLSTDGLHDEVGEEEILDTLATVALKDTPKALIDLANERGGRDNITVVVIQV